MKDKQPILSICIPTYNRAEILRDTLEQYTSCEEFDDDVEIVISDNASPDHTQDVCAEFTTKYKNVRYFRNAQNVRDENFIIVQNYAKGLYIKLMNDNIYMPNEALRNMKNEIRLYKENRIPIFFVTGPIFQRMQTHEYTCKSMDEYVQQVSMYVTAISCFGAWKTDWDAITNKQEYSKLLLSQVDWSYQIVVHRGQCKLIYLEPYWLLSKDANNKFSQSYNFFQIHLANYTTIKQIYVEKGLITKQTMRRDGHVFLNHYRKKIWAVLFGKRNDVFDYTDSMKILKKYFSTDPYFYWYMISFPLWYAGDLMRRAMNKCIRIWRK